MDTSKLDAAIDEENNLHDQLFNKLMSQIKSNINDLKELSVAYTNNLFREDGSLICVEPFKIILFSTGLLESNKVNVYLDTSEGAVVYDSFDSEIGSFLPRDISPDQLKILLSVEDNFESAMYSTNPDRVIKTTLDYMGNSNNTLREKLNENN